MAIDNFQNGEGGGSVRTKINEAIDAANDLDDRVGAASGAGIVAIDGLGESVRRTLMSDDSSVEITNGDGVSENPNVSVADYVTSRVGQGDGIAAYDAQGNPLRRSVVSSDGSIEIANPDGVAGDVDLSVADDGQSAFYSSSRNRQMDEQVYKIIRDALGPDAPLPYVLDEANGVYPHTTRGEFARLGGAWQINRFGRWEQVGPDVRRDSFTGQGAPRGRLYEPEAENMEEFPNDPSQWSFFGDRFEITDGPDGQNGTEISQIGEDDNLTRFTRRYAFGQPIEGEATQYRVAEVKIADGSAKDVRFGSSSPSLQVFVDLSTGQILQEPSSASAVARVQRMAGGWVRIEIWSWGTDLGGTSADGIIRWGNWDGSDLVGSEGDKIRIRNVLQILYDGLGTLISSTFVDGFTVRPPDLPTYPLTSDWFNPEEGTFVWVGRLTHGDDVDIRMYPFGGASNSFRFGPRRLAGRWELRNLSGPSGGLGSLIDDSDSGYVTGSRSVISYSWRAGDRVSGAINGFYGQGSVAAESEAPADADLTAGVGIDSSDRGSNETEILLYSPRVLTQAEHEALGALVNGGA